MMAAIELILNKQMSCAQAARWCNIPYSTLYNSYKVALAKQSENAKPSEETKPIEKPHGHKKTWTQKNMKKAIKLVLTKQMFCHQAAICCNVPYTALYKATISKRSKRVRSKAEESVKVESSEESNQPQQQIVQSRKGGHSRRRVWSQKNLEKALELVLSNQMLCHHAARLCDVPYTALYNSYKATLSKQTETAEPVKGEEESDDDKPLILCKQHVQVEQSKEVQETKEDEAKIEQQSKEEQETKGDEAEIEQSKEVQETKGDKTGLQNIRIDKIFSNGLEFVDIEDAEFSNM